MTVPVKQEKKCCDWIQREEQAAGASGGGKENAMTADCRSNSENIYLTGRLAEGAISLWCLYRWRNLMQERKAVSRRAPIRYVVERVYSGTESMERVLTTVSEEAARKNVEEKLKNSGKNEGSARKER